MNLKTPSHSANKNLRDVILGGQDGLVNVLGVVLGVSAATTDLKIIVISGLAATFAESISMAAVAYTSTEAALSEYLGKLQGEKKEVEEAPSEGVKDVKKVFENWGFTGDLLEQATKKIIANKDLWTRFMMTEELSLSKNQIEQPIYSAVVVGLASLIGSFIPLVSFFFIHDIKLATYTSLIISAIFLFTIGFIKAKLTIGNPLKSGFQITLIGMVSALAGYLIGKVLGGITI